MNIVKKITICLLFLMPLTSMAQSSSAKDRGYVIWDFDLGYDFGDYNLASIDGGAYSSIILGTRIGFNFSKLFLGVEGRWGFPSFSTEYENRTIDNLNNPIPDDSSTAWGPTLSIKFNAIEFHYTLLSESFKYQGTVSANDPRDIYYRHEGTGHKVGLGLRMFDNVFLVYNYRETEFDRYVQRIDGVESTGTMRDIPMTIRSHFLGVRVPIDLSFLPKLIRDSFLK